MMLAAVSQSATAPLRQLASRETPAYVAPAVAAISRMLNMTVLSRRCERGMIDEWRTRAFLAVFGLFDGAF